MKIRIISPSDRSSRPIPWQDYWIKKDLEVEFTKRGYEIVKANADLDFCLFGDYRSISQMTAPRRFCWLYSHPDEVRKDFSLQFEHVFVLSRAFLSKVDGSTLLFGASSKEFIPRKEEARYDVVFMGNPQKPERVKIIKHLCGLKKYKICLVGDWVQIEGAVYEGFYVDNSKMGQFFNRGLLSFYAAHEDMRMEGFVAVRILDIFRSSENLCISDDNAGLKDMFREIPTFKNKEDLVHQIDWFLQHPREREEIALKCREDAKQWTFDRTVTEIEKWI